MPNALARETSPYLLQHADNPVDWLPWSDAAFEAASRDDKPVLLSIGYSACHWCHVMAHESFENDAIAAVMNDLYVNVKVDREERPDVDKVYQLAHQLLTQRGGGWPLTMFLDPKTRRPFFGGTYFPHEARYGMPAFPDLLRQVANYFHEQRDAVSEQGGRLVDFMASLDPSGTENAGDLDDQPIDGARQTLARTFDREFGGFGGAPKFPHPANLGFLLRRWRATAYDAEPDLDALFMATLSLTRMAESGLFDHLGGGFCRYAVDREWQIPHFEKMLYDNGPLLALYAEAHLATGDTAYADVAHATAGWMLADMQAPDGGFFSTRDADSEGEEGRYYVWSREELADRLAPDEWAVFAERFGLAGTPNFEGHWHLAAKRSVADIAADAGLDEDVVRQRLESARATLFDVRSRRVEPGRDEKKLCAWNALAIRGFAIAARALDRDDYADAAAQGLAFIRRELYRDGRLLAVSTDGQSRFAGYLDDYAFLLDALLEVLQVRWSSDDLAFAIHIADALLAHFADDDAGGFWFTANDAEALVHRPKPFADEALPSGNGVAAFALQRLGFLLGEERYLAAARATLRAAWPAISEYPHGHVTLLGALDEALAPPEIVVLRGEAAEVARWRRSAAALYAPRRLVFAIPADAGDLPGALAARAARPGETLAYRCTGTECGLPVTSWEALAAQISGN